MFRKIEPVRYLLITAFLFCIMQNLFAQDATILQLEVFRVYTSTNEDPANDDEFRWKLWLNDGYQGCIEVNGDRGYFNRHMGIFINRNYSNVGVPLKFTLETWENDGGHSCVYDSDDEAHCGPTPFYLTLADHEPEVMDTFELAPCDRFKLWIRYSYSVPRPASPTVSPAGAVQVCDAAPSITLTSGTALNAALLPRCTFQWEYSSSVSPGWQRLATRTGRVGYTFTDIRRLAGIPNNRTVDVRFRVRIAYLTSTGALHYSDYAESPEAIHLSPVPPAISNITVEPTCYGLETGIIRGNVAGLYSSYRYILRVGQNNPCDPNNPQNCGGVKSELIFPQFGFFEIRGVPKGEYTLVITNPGNDYGVCPTSYNTPVVIGERPPLSLTAAATGVSCQNGFDASVTLTTTGGSTPVTYTLGKDGSTLTNTTGLFASLSAGTYQATARDAICQQLVATTVAVIEPVRVNARTLVTQATCHAPVNGAVQVNIISPASTPPYDFTIRRGEEVVQQSGNFAGNTWSASGLPAGTYTIDVRDAQRPQCDGHTEEVVVSEPEALGLTALNAIRTDADCYGRRSGSITLRDVDLSGQYTFTLTPADGSSTQVLTTTPLFTDLAAGDYTLHMQRNLAGCSDRADYPASLQIAQPPQAVITLDKQDISCHGETDGTITASVAGATQSDQYIWEVMLADSWATLGNQTHTLQNLSPGTYRMRLTNDHSCTATSTALSIIEPGALSVSSVHIKDVACYGMQGEVTVLLEGGTMPYAYAYTSPAQVVRSASSQTLLDPGTYALQVRDARGCTVMHAGSVILTAPDAPLAMSMVRSDYNGFNISCAGATDGYVVVIAEGGNGGSFSGYECALDGGTFQPGVHVRNISAGDHVVSVRDGRGCTVSSAVVMTSPASRLQALVLRQYDIKCAGDDNGAIVLQAQGGVSPYTYALNGISQDAGMFSSLPPGDHTIVITDRNQCRTEYTANIAVRVPPMYLQLATTDVLCYAGSDGTVLAQVTGGASPYRYQWGDLPGDTPELTTLPAGSYSLTVTDDEGCLQERGFTIKAPAPLTAGVVTIPVCVGKDNGEIRLQAGGGTPAYRYSIDNGTTYQDLPRFAVPAGIYPARVIDRHHCETPLTVVVTSRSDVPDPDFIVAMTQQASDTLQVREISVPKPDSVWWTFDPAIRVVNSDRESPLITVPEAGDYSITMQGFFGGCDYARTLTLTISPFDAEVKAVREIPVRVIKTLKAMPNTNDGRFDLTVEMEAKQRLTVTVYDMLGVSHYRQRWDKTTGIVTPVDISATAAAGVYVVQVITDTDVREIRLIVNK
jgi:hypothetical protein